MDLGKDREMLLTAACSTFEASFGKIMVMVHNSPPLAYQLDSDNDTDTLFF